MFKPHAKQTYPSGLRACDYRIAGRFGREIPAAELQLAASYRINRRRLFFSFCYCRNPFDALLIVRQREELTGNDLELIEHLFTLEQLYRALHAMSVPVATSPDAPVDALGQQS